MGLFFCMHVLVFFLFFFFFLNESACFYQKNILFGCFILDLFNRLSHIATIHSSVSMLNA